MALPREQSGSAAEQHQMVATAMDDRRQPAVFLDRDGVLVRPDFRDGRSFAPMTLDGFSILPEARPCLDRLKSAGFRLIVVTNQPDVGAGRVARDIVANMHEQLCAALPIDDVRVCFHTREDACDCRKPLPGMLTQAAHENNVDLSASIMIGDRASDIVAGEAAGCRTAFIDLGYTAEKPPAHADFVAQTLGEVTEWILKEHAPSP